MAAIVLFLSLFARIPLGYLLARSAIILPFSGFAAVTYAFTIPEGRVLLQIGSYVLTSHAVEMGAFLLLRSGLAVCFMIILINTCPFDRLLSALRSLKVPALFILLLAFFYRFLYLLWDEAERMQRARNLRYFGGRWKQQPALLGRLVTALFIRSYERSERVALAMQARGWDGESWPIKVSPLAHKDILYSLIGMTLLISLWMLRRF